MRREGWVDMDRLSELQSIRLLSIRRASGVDSDILG